MRAPNRYYDRHFALNAVKLLPGEFYVTRRLLLVTVLGSCVAACLRDTVTGIQGMNHFLLPGEDGASNSLASRSTRYGVFAMETLLNEMIKAGARRDSIEAKVFGGGAVLEGVDTARVGERNAAFVQNFLRQENIPLRAHDLCGPYPRKVYFFPESGKVSVRVMKRLHNDTILRRETEYAQELDRIQVAGDVELF